MDDNGRVAGTIADISRMIGKLTFMPRPGATTADFQSKFSSILDIVGNNTPVISTYCRRWLELSGRERLEHSQTRFCPGAPYWLTLVDEWTMFPEPTQELIDFALDQLHENRRISPAAMLELDRRLEESQSIDELQRYYISNEEPEPGRFRILGDNAPEPPPVQLGRPGRNN